MPRPKSEYTKSRSGKAIGARVTVWQFNEWKRLGSSAWLKKILTESYKRHMKDQLNKEQPNGNDQH